jgi:hypothetical protein
VYLILKPPPKGNENCLFYIQTNNEQRQAKMPAAGATQALRLCLTVVFNWATFKSTA